MGSNDAPNPSSTSSPDDPAPSALAGLALSALTSLGYRPAGSDTDGYELLASTSLDAVMIRPVYHGKLRDYSTRGVRHAWIARYTRALEHAGLHTAFVDVGGSPVGVIAAQDPVVAAQAAADAVARMGRRDGGADG